MCSCFFLRRRIFCHMRLMSVSRTFPLLWPKRMFLHNFWHTRQRFWKIVCLDRRVCTQVLRLRTTDYEEDWQQRPRRTSGHHDWPWQSRRLTMKNDRPRRLSTIWLCTILTYEDASVCNFWHTCSCLGGKFELFCSLRTHYESCSLLKKDVSVCIFWHTSPWLCAVSSIIFHKILSTARHDDESVC